MKQSEPDWPGCEVGGPVAARRCRPGRAAACPGSASARSSTSAGDSSGSASESTRCVSAIQIGKLLITGPALAIERVADRRHAGAELLEMARRVRDPAP